MAYGNIHIRDQVAQVKERITGVAVKTAINTSKPLILCTMSFTNADGVNDHTVTLYEGNTVLHVYHIPKNTPSLVITNFNTGFDLCSFQPDNAAIDILATYIA